MEIQHDSLLLRRIKDLETNEKWLLKEKLTEENRREEETKILNEKLRAAESENFELTKKLYLCAEEVARLKEKNQSFLKKVHNLEYEKRKTGEDHQKLKEKSGEHIPDGSPSSGTAKNQQQRLSNSQIDVLKAESDEEKQSFKDLKRKLEMEQVVAKRKMNLMEIEMDKLSRENKNLRNQLQAMAGKQDKIWKLDQLVKREINLSEGVGELKEQKNIKVEPMSHITPKMNIMINGRKGSNIANGNGFNDSGEGTSQGIRIKVEVVGVDNQQGALGPDNRDQTNKPALKRSRLGEHSGHVLDIKKEK